MKALTAILLTAACIIGMASQYTQTEMDAKASVHFSPDGGCTAEAVKEMGYARGRLLIQAYSFTSAPIAKAAAEAKRRGVEVVAILDKSQETEKYSEADYLVHAGIPTYIDDQHKIAHNKIMIIDDRTVLTGSFNFTKAAEDGNAENLLTLRSEELAARYTENFMLHKAHSRPYSRQ